MIIHWTALSLSWVTKRQVLFGGHEGRVEYLICQECIMGSRFSPRDLCKLPTNQHLIGYTSVMPTSWISVQTKEHYKGDGIAIFALPRVSIFAQNSTPGKKREDQLAGYMYCFANYVFCLLQLVQATAYVLLVEVQQCYLQHKRFEEYRFLPIWSNQILQQGGDAIDPLVND